MFSPSLKKAIENNGGNSIDLPFRKVSQLQQLNLYRRVQKPSLNANRLKTISDQIQLGQISNTSFINRKRNQDYMFNYNYNPFTFDLQQHNQFHVQRQSNKHFQTQHPNRQDKQQDNLRGGENLAKVRNIIDQIRKYQTNTKIQIRGNMSNTLRDMMNSNESQSYKIQKQVHRTKIQPSFAKAISQINTARPMQQISSKLIFSDELDFSQIVSLKEKSFYIEHFAIKNAFRFLFEPELQKKAGKQILDSFYFCHNSARDIIQKRKILIYRDISRFSRRLILQKHTSEIKSDYLHANQTNPQLNQLQIHTIMSISGGRTKPDELKKLLMNDFTSAKKQNQTITSLLQEQQIWYSQNSRNAKSAKKGQLDEKFEVNKFKQLGFVPKQQKYQQELLEQLNLYKQGLSYQKYLLSQTITDTKLITTLKDTSNQKIENMIHSWEKQKDIDRLIRKNKIYKNRIEQLQVKNLTSVLRTKKEHSLIMKGMQRTMSKSKSRSKSPLANRIKIK